MHMQTTLRQNVTKKTIANYFRKFEFSVPLSEDSKKKKNTSVTDDEVRTEVNIGYIFFRFC